jgi:hypothetical protein
MKRARRLASPFERLSSTCHRRGTGRRSWNAFLAAVVVASGALLAGCGGGGSGGGASGSGGSAQAGRYLGIDLTTTQGFFIAPAPAQASADAARPWRLLAEALGIRPAHAASASTPNRLFALGKDNRVTAIRFDKESEVFTPLGVVDTRKYLLLMFRGLFLDDRSCTLVAVRKSDRQMFCSEIQVQVPVTACPGCASASDRLQTDASGDRLVLETFEGIVRLDMTDPDAPTKTLLFDTNTDGRPIDFRANPDGDVLARVSDFTGGIRTLVYKASAGFQTITTDMSFGCLMAGIGTTSNDFFAFASSTAAGSSGQIVRLRKNGTSFERSVWYVDPEPMKPYTGTGPFLTEPNPAYVGIGSAPCQATGSIARAAGRIYARPASLPPSADGVYFIEAINESAVPARIVVPGYTALSHLLADATGVIVVGRNDEGVSGVKRYDPASGTFTELVALGQYTIAGASANPQGDVVFTGRRADDNARVMGTLKAGVPGVSIVPFALQGDVATLILMKQEQ